MATTVSITNNGNGKYTIKDSDGQTRVVNQAQATAEAAKAKVQISNPLPGISSSGTGYSLNTGSSFPGSNQNSSLGTTDLTVLIADPKTGKMISAPVADAVALAYDAKRLGVIRSNLLKYGQLTKAEARDPNNLLNKWAQIVYGAANDSNPKNRDPFVYAAALQKAGFGSTAANAAGSGYTGPMVYPRLTSAEDAKAKIVDSFKTLLNREPTADEIDKATKALNADENNPKNYQTQTPIKNAAGQVIGYKTTGGTDTGQFLTDYINSNFAKEAEAIKTQAPEITNLKENKKLYQDALAKLGPNPDPAAVANLKATTTYGQGLTETENAIKALVRSSDASNTPEEIAKLAEDAYNQGLKINSNTFSQYVNSNLKFGGTTSQTTTPQTTATGPATPKVFEKTGEVAPTFVTPTTTATGPATPAGGTGGQTLTNLKSVALKNGINLDDPKYADQVAKWVADIKAGADVEKYYSFIRNEAGANKSAWIKKQLAAGSNLSEIYSTAIKQVANAFGLDEASVDLNDPIFSKIFTDKGAVDNNTLATIIHNDSRWTGSPEADKRETATQLNVQSLENLAKNNNIDLATLFPQGLDAVAKDITDGKTSLDKIANTIRSKAAEGQTKFVQDQLKSGRNLRDIYGTYINQIATALGVDAATIDLTDPLLANVFSDKGALSTLDFKNLIRKDDRFKNTAGAIGENQTLQSIKNIALQQGAELSDEDAASILETAASKGLSANSPEIVNLINGKISYKPGTNLKGNAGTNLQELRNTAMANGMDLDKMFGSNVQDWLQKLAQGESVDTFKKIIRETAKVGLPDTVKKLIDQGVDLNTIYSPYRNMMANVLEVDPNSIDINDPTLRGAIGPDKEMSLYEWQRALRKDPRWQYTNNAKAEVSNAVQGVLKDFGFVG